MVSVLRDSDAGWPLPDSSSLPVEVSQDLTCPSLSRVCVWLPLVADTKR